MQYIVKLQKTIMKKIILLIAAMAMATMTFAQKAPGSWTFTPSVGLTVANITSNQGFDPKAGLIAGAEAMYQVSDVFALSGGVYYAMEGCKHELEMEDIYYYSSTTRGNNSPDIAVTDAHDYLNIPILVQAYVVKGLAVKLGLQPAFLLSAKSKSHWGDGDNGHATYDIKNGLNTVELSMPIGVSYEYKNIVLDARYNLGLTNVQKSCLIPGFGFKKNSVFQVMVGYRL